MADAGVERKKSIRKFNRAIDLFRRTEQDSERDRNDGRDRRGIDRALDRLEEIKA